MSVISFEGIEKLGGIPEDAHVRMESLSGQITPAVMEGEKQHSIRARNKDVIYSGYVTGGMISLNLDPGLYAYKVRHMPEDGVGKVSYVGDFYHECTPSQFNKITHMKPNMAKATMTTDGVRFTCTFPGCKKKTSSKIAALLHETRVHYGVDLLENPDLKESVDEQYKEQQQSVGGPGSIRRPGRPLGSKNKSKDN